MPTLNPPASPLARPIPPRCTPVPNALLDDWMPGLTDTELRVLLVVTRQTLGFQASIRVQAQGRKNPDAKNETARRSRDWITHARLKQKTGRASAALSHAVDSLVKKGLLLVCTQDGMPLMTPQERRRCRGKLFFSLAPRLLAEA